MYPPGKGAGYTAACTIRGDGGTPFDFHDDSQPEWQVHVAPGSYVEDSQLFPRDDEHHPEWLKHKVREATAMH